MQKDAKAGLAVSSIIFAVFGLIHLLRLIFHVSITVAGIELPIAGSGVATVVFWALAYWLWTLRKQ